MRRSSRLALAGVVLLATALALPAVDFATADWDRDYRYRTPADGFCADAVDDLRAGETTASDGFVVDRANLSAAALANVRRAEENGSHVVDTAAEAAGPFVFPSDHWARGTGCYAVRGVDDEYLALVTETVSRRTDTLAMRLAQVGSHLAAALGGLSLLVGVVIEIRRALR